MTFRKKLYSILVLIVLIVSIFFLKNQTRYITDEGTVFGTYYNIQYEAKKNYHQEIKNLFNTINHSLSTYDSSSIISKINKNQTVKLDSHFIKVFEKSEDVYQTTQGAFDITISPLVDAWGFGAGKKLEVDSLLIDSLLIYIGIHKVKYSHGKIIKSNPGIQLDVSAIAKGYAVDVIAEYLIKKNLNNFLVEIGGEIRAKGQNKKSQPWSVGINKPIDDRTPETNEIFQIVKISNGALATSGNYRQFYYNKGKKYAHIINPQTGYPVQHNLLSVTVFAKDCISADAFATAFMVMGVEKSMNLANNHSGIDIYIIYNDKNGRIKSDMTGGFVHLIYE